MERLAGCRRRLEHDCRSGHQFGGEPPGQSLQSCMAPFDRSVMIDHCTVNMYLGRQHLVCICTNPASVTPHFALNCPQTRCPADLKPGRRCVWVELQRRVHPRRNHYQVLAGNLVSVDQPSCIRIYGYATTVDCRLNAASLCACLPPQQALHHRNPRQHLAPHKHFVMSFIFAGSCASLSSSSSPST